MQLNDSFLASKQYDCIFYELSEFPKVTEVKPAAPQLRWRTPTHEHGNHVEMKVIIMYFFKAYERGTCTVLD